MPKTKKFQVPTNSVIDQATRFQEQHDKLVKTGASPEQIRAAFDRLMAYKIKHGLVEEIDDPDED